MMCLCLLVGGDVSVRAGFMVMCLCVLVGGDVSVRDGWW